MTHGCPAYCVCVSTDSVSGDPHSAAVQEVMGWQYRTISAVYSMVGGALKAAGRTSESPLDYFQVLCLGNRCAWPCSTCCCGRYKQRLKTTDVVHLYHKHLFCCANIPPGNLHPTRHQRPPPPRHPCRQAPPACPHQKRRPTPRRLGTMASSTPTPRRRGRWQVEPPWRAAPWATQRPESVSCASWPRGAL